MHERLLNSHIHWEGYILPNSKDKTAGFTLLEILIAVLIFGIIMMTLFSAFRSFVVSSRMIRSHIARTDKGTLMMERLMRDLRGFRVALPPEYRKPSERDGVQDPFQIAADSVNLGGRSFSRLTFVSLSHAPFGDDPRTGAARITYYPRENGDGSVDLCRSDRLVLVLPETLDEVQSACDPVLCRNIEQFELTFIDHQGEERDHWDSDSDAFDLATPRAIHLSMGFYLSSHGSIWTSDPATYPEAVNLAARGFQSSENIHGGYGGGGARSWRHGRRVRY